jgi:hypothetical protein
MIRTLRICIVFIAAFGFTAASAVAQETIVAHYTGTQEPGGGAEKSIRPQPAATQAAATSAVISFNAAAVGISSATAQTLTATFQVSGYTGTFTPTATLHYGLSYSAGAVSCTGGVSPETCTVALKFLPQYPGGRKDALFLMNGATRLATVLLYGAGQAPLALFQPGSVVSTYASSGGGSNSYFYQSVTDENGTVWSIGDNVNTLSSLTKTGTFNLISMTGLSNPQAIAIDGAGVLYIAYGGAPRNNFITYDTVQGTQGTFTLPASQDFNTVGVGNTGNVYAVDTNNDVLYTVKPDGTSTNVALVNGSTSQADTPLSLTVDSSENLFFGGYWTENEYSSGGVQSTINTTSDKGGIAVDAADTVYLGLAGNTQTVVELAASNYATPSTTLDSTYSFGVSLGADGTANIGDYFNLVQYVRSQGALTFTNVASGTTSAPQTVGIYNGGNLPLNISNIALTGAGFAMQSAPTNNCSGGIVLAPGTSCQVMVTFTSPHGGSFAGSLAFTSNSLNGASTVSTAALTATTSAAYLVASSTALNFNTQVINTTSAAQTVTITNQGFGQSATITTPTSFAGVTAAAGTCTGATATLAVGASCQLSVTFTPTTPQNYSGTITVNSSINGISTSFTAVGTGLPVFVESTSLIFNPAPVAEAQASAQTITASFTLSGYTTTVAPTAAMHYGLAFTAGTVSCTGNAGNQSCTVPVTFLPNYPGGRRDALVLTVNGTAVATVQAYGVGQAPLALTQPGVITQPITSGGYYYNSTVGEDGTAYVLGQNTNTIYSISPAGVVTQLPITGLQSPSKIAIDGAGTLYIAENTYAKYLVTYTAAGVQGQVSVVPPSGSYTPCSNSNGGTLYYPYMVSEGIAGDLYVYELLCQQVFEFKRDGTFATTTSPVPSFNGVATMAVDSAENVFVGGYAINEITAGGTQTQINAAGAGDGLDVDAADTLYASRYSFNGSGSVAELPAVNFAAPIAEVDTSANPLGNSVGANGTVYVGNYNQVDKVDRTQGAPISFGAQNNGSPSSPQAIQIYNGGNLPLTLSNFSVTGEGFALNGAATNPCSSGLVIAPGALCNASVIFTGTHSGTFNGSISYTTNTLNTTSTTQTVALSAYINGIYVTASPNPLNFANQVVGSTSAAQTITLTNNGINASAYIGAASLPTGSGFSVSMGTCTAAVAPGTSCNLSVTFSPTVATAYSGTITSTDGSSASTQTQTVTLTVTGMGYTVVTPTNSLIFNPAPVAIAPASAQTIVASFTISGYSSTFTPTAAMRYGLNYTTGALSCSGPVSNETCTIPVTFIPQYPGGRRDAVVISVAGAPIGYLQAYGVGQSPLALIQPGIVTNASGNSSTPLYFQSVVGEDGTVYTASESSNVIVSLTKAGVQNTIAIPGSAVPYSVAIDGAGILYVANNGYSNVLYTYNTATGALGTFNIVPPAPYKPCSTSQYPNTVAAGIAGDLYVYELICNQIYEFKRDGTFTATALNPAFNGVGSLAVDSAENVFIGGYDINELTPAGVQTQVNTIGAGQGLGIDAAGTLYPTRYNTPGVGELPASNYAQSEAALDRAAPYGDSVAPDGTLYVGDYSNLDKVDRSQGLIDFGEQYQSFGTASPPQSASIYNGGNLPLTVSNITVSGVPFALQASTTNNCTNGLVLAPGALCNLTVTMTPTRAGIFPGSITFTTNTLNTSSTTQTIALSAFTNGAYFMANPNPVNFGNVVSGSTAQQTITFTNNGYGGASGFGVGTFSGPGYSLVLSGCNSVAFGSSCTGVLTFAPTAVQSYNGVTLALSAGYSGGGPNQAFTLTMNGAGTAAPAPAVTLAPTSVPFGGQLINTTSAASLVQVTNSGSATLNLTSVTLTGANSTAFALTTAPTSPCGSTLSAGASCYLGVTFTPTTVTSYSANISVADNATGSPQIVPLTGSGIAPQASLSASTPFASQTINTTSSAQTFTLSNPGNATLNITSIGITGTGATDFAISAQTCTTTLAAAGTCTISVTFTPLSVASFTAALTITDSATGSPQSATLTGSGTAVPAPIAGINPATAPFGNQTVNTTSSAQTFTVSNTGNAALTLSSITLGGTNPGAFALAGGTCATTVAASSSCTIAVTFTPTGATSYAATLNVANNAAGSPLVVTFTGTGTAAPAPIAGISPGSGPFGNQTVNTTSSAQTFTVSNTGNAALTLSSITLVGTNPGAFALAGGTCATTVAASSNCTIAVTFTPTGATSYAATLNVANNAAGSPLVVTLTGTGTAVPAPIASLTPSTLTFATTNVGSTTAPQTLTLSNTGNAALTISGITLAGANPADFAETTSCGTTLAAGTNCTVSVTFTPLSGSAFTATVSVADNAAGSPHTASLSGTGTSTTTSDFSVAAPAGSQSVDPGAAAQFTINVSALSGNYTLPVVLSVTGLPSGATASFNPASVTPGSTGASSILTVQTPLRAALEPPPHSPSGTVPWFAVLLLPLLGVRPLRRKLRRLPLSVRALLLCALALGGMASLSGCGGGYFGPTPQTVTLTVTGTSGTLQHSTTVTLTVQ